MANAVPFFYCFVRGDYPNRNSHGNKANNRKATNMSGTYKDKPYKLRGEYPNKFKSQGHNKHLVMGPGGMGCPCCFPSPSSYERKMEFRRAKKLEAKAHFNSQEN